VFGRGGHEKMELKIDVERINDGRAIPSTLITVMFLLFIFWIVQRVNIPQEARKPSEEMMINFLREEKKPIKPQEEKKEKIKKEEKEVPVEVVEEEVLEEQQEFVEPEEEVFTETEVAPNVILTDMSDHMNQELEDMLQLPGGDGVTDLLTDINNPNALLEAGADAGGGAVGFGDTDIEAKINITQNNMDWGAHQKRTHVNKPTKARRRPTVDLRSGDFINPIIRWMEANPATFPDVLKAFLDFAPGNLTSKTKVKFNNKTYFIYFLCKKALPQLSICVVDFETEEVVLIKDAGLMKETGYLMEGRFYATTDGKDFGMFTSEQKKASGEKADKFSDIFWNWFATVNPDK
jgi:hypothetical protein